MSSARKRIDVLFGLNVMTDPPNEFYESGTVPGLGGFEDRSPKAKQKPNQIDLSCFAGDCQLEFPFIRPQPKRSPRLSRSQAPMRVGPTYTNLVCQRCRTFVHYLSASKRRCYFCACGNVLLSARDPLNDRPPRQAEWQKLVSEFHVRLVYGTVGSKGSYQPFNSSISLKSLIQTIIYECYCLLKIGVRSPKIVGKPSISGGNWWFLPSERDGYPLRSRESS